eukprot:TRINITY_DN10950_c0_g1_i3.p2 TRINITY_DN10950_c0_g1~~TRINITY_DN10950_c0_g1_i3.p2  ORF type:complete len:282 (+),score=37.55 TRINITY_DN10950_c0_g1_i3:152-997(+)
MTWNYWILPRSQLAGECTKVSQPISDWLESSSYCAIGPAVMSCAAGAALPSATMSTISDYLVAGGFDGYEALDAIHRIVVELCSPGIDVEDKTTSNDGCARFSLRVQADWDTLATPRKNATMWASPSGAAIVAGGWDGDETLGTWERIDSGGAEGYVCSTGMLRPRECHGMANGWLIGGYNSEDCLLDDSDMIGVLDLQNADNLPRPPPLPSPRECVACATNNSTIYCVGGWNGFEALDQVLYWSPADGKDDGWQQLPSLPVPLNRPCAVVVDVELQHQLS